MGVVENHENSYRNPAEQTFGEKINLTLVEKMRKGARVVIVDIDNTIAKTVISQTGYMRKLAEEAGVAYDDTGIAVRALYAPELEKFRKSWFDPSDESRSGRFMSIPLHMYVLGCIEALENEGFEVHIVSSRQADLRDTTLAWLESVGLGYLITQGRVHLLEPDLENRLLNNGGREMFKLELAESLANTGREIVCAIDDSPKVASSFAERKMPVLKISRPWMRDKGPKEAGTDSDYIIRVASFPRAVATLIRHKRYLYQQEL